MTNAFPREVRIREKEAFSKRLFARDRLSGHYYILFYRPNERGYSRLGVIAGKRKIRTAVLRNRVKRIAREAFRLQQGRLQSIDVILVAKAISKEVDRQQLRQCLDKLFMQLTAC